MGPNGSGKSNVVDALAWVMGEQGAKSLRGGNMADVIFAGTSGRQALGRAEVALTIDNTDGALPIEYSEVTISRTLFRSGGSEYAINGTTCRLLDIQELLSDTGMGRQMHVIVGQGQLDAVLHATPEDRRAFIEEAAGVLKHRRRKERALRRLETMAANLARVEDLTAEIRRQLGPLARQADMARRAQVIQADLRDALSRLLADDYAQVEAQLAAEHQGSQALSKQRAEATAALQRQREELAEAEAAAQALGPRVKERAGVVVALTTLRERIASIQALAAERARFIDTPPPRPTGPDPEELEQQASVARQSEAELRAECTRAEATLASMGQAREVAEKTEREAEQRLAAVHRGVADRREGLARLAGQVSAREQRLEAAEAEYGRLEARLAEAIERAAAAERDYAEVERHIAAHGEDENLEAAHERDLAAAEEADSRVRDLLEREREAHARVERARTQRETLALSLERKDATAELSEQGLAAGLLPQYLKVPAHWRTAVAAALDAMAAAAIVEDMPASIQAMQWAQNHEAGLVRLIHPGPAPASADLAAYREYGTPAVDVVDATEYPAQIRALLGPIVLVDDLTQAAALITAHPHAIAATAGGQVLAGTWARSGQEGASDIDLYARYEEAGADLAEASQDEADLTAQRKEAEVRTEEARQRAGASLAAVRQADAQRARDNQQLAQAATALRSAQAEVERTGPALAQLREDLTTYRSDVAELRERLDVAQKEPEVAEEELAQAQQSRDDAAAAASTARRAETDARLQLRTVQERMAALAGRAEQLSATAAQERAARTRAHERWQRRHEAAEGAQVVHDHASQALAAMDNSLAQARAEHEIAETEQQHSATALTHLRAQVETTAEQLRQLTDAAHQEELARAQVQSRLDNLAEKIANELGVEPQTLVDEFGPHRPIIELKDEAGEPVEVEKPYVRAEQEKRYARAQRDVARLGKINPLALEEHAALNERHQFLQEQVSDLKKSRADLLTIIREIDERVERVFAEAYADTAREFEQVFDRLFPGGEGRLVLTDPDDMLTTGIEVEARPAGKKVKRLSLLSGGERSLTAVALLVAIFKARPSPFYVMDEVEAALDDRNLDRLLGIFKELQRDSQLIVITHQKRTMEIADALYGVSMREGVSQVISQRL